MRYKDLAALENTVAKASLALSGTTATEGPLERNVLKNFLALHLSRELEGAADMLDRGDQGGALARIEHLEIYGSDFLQRPHRLSRATGKRPVTSRCSQNMSSR